MKKVMIPFVTPESSEDCNELSCDNCSIMHDTVHSSTIPTCFYLEKSFEYFKMMGASC